jgi:drug/metabolite transporter (DMT)-like permease
MAAYQVAFFTVFTPLYVTLIHDLLRRRFHLVFLLTSLLAVGGAAAIAWSGGDFRGVVTGFLVLQVSNVCFAFGQVGYKMLMEREPGLRDRDVFGLLYLGAAAITAIPACLTVEWGELRLTGTQVLVLLYLGALPSGLGFFLWNVGATRSNAGTLAVFNNAKIPLAVLCSLLFFGEQADLAALAIGGIAMVLAVAINERYARSRQSVP